MKKSKSYFGNRFNTALRSIRSRKRTPQISVLPAPAAAASEFEALEGRILLSGLTDGTKVLKSLTFTDADGDKVSIKVTGKLAKGAGFQVPDLGNGFDVDEINLVGLTKANSLTITVTPVKLLATSQTTTGGSLWSPGYTNIGSIVSDVQTTNTGAATAASAAVRNLGISAAVVSDINLPATDIIGSITVNTGKTAWIDRINTASAANQGNNTDGYNPVAGLIDLGDVTAKSIGRITINGIVSSPVDPNNALPGSADTNDINGTIAVSGNLGGITAVRSIINGDVNVGGDLGKIQAAQFNGNINVGGDLTIVLPSGSAGTISAGGHVNLGFGAGPGGWASVTAGEGISGIQSSLTDTINVPSAYVGTLNNLSTASKPGFGVADIQVTGSAAAAFDINSGNSIGNITANQLGGGMDVVAGAGGIGKISTIAGSLAGNYTSGGNIGNLSTNSAAAGITGNFTAAADIGNIVATSLNGNAITGNFIAGNSIGTITATSTVGGDAITGFFQAKLGNIGGIVANATGTNGGNDAISGAVFLAAGNIGSIAATASAGDALDFVNVTADTDASGAGDIGTITATTASTVGGSAILGGNYTAVNIGNIVAKATGVTGAGDAIDGAVFTGVTNTETAVGSGKFNNLGTIGTITVSNASTNLLADGIVNAVFNAGAAGKIGNISVSAAGGDGISNSDFNADLLSAGKNDTIFTGSIGTVTVTKAGAQGIDNGSDFVASASIGDISVTSVGSGIVGTVFAADSNADNTGGIGNITVTTSGVNANGISGGSSFDGATIGNIQVTLAATAGTGDAIAGATFKAVTNTETAAASGKFNNLGTIGSITVNNASTNAAADGIFGGSFKAGAAGSIGAISVTTAGGNGIDGVAFSTELSAGGKDTTLTGNIGAVTVNSAASGIVGGSSFTSVAGVGAITVTAAFDGLDGLTVAADSNNDGTGGIASITATSATGFAITGGTYTGASIGNITAAVTDKAATTDAISGATFTAVTNTETAPASGKFNNLGTIGTITVNNASTDSSADGIFQSKFNAGAAGSIGNISATVAGDDALNDVVFNASNTTGTDTITTGSVGTITASAADEGLETVTVTTAVGGSIGAISVTSAGKAITDSKLTAGTSIGAITAAVSTALSNAIDTTTLTAANVGAVTVTGTNLGIASLTANGTTSVGAITSSGTSNQEVTLNAPTIGAVTFNSLALGTTAKVIVGATATSLGAITVDAPAALATAGLSLTGGSANLVTLGKVSVDGNADISGVTLGAKAVVGDITVGGTLTVVGALSTAKTIGAFTVNTLAVPGAVNAIGAGTVGGSIGLITIGVDVANVGANKYNFSFDAYNGAPNDVIISSPAPVQTLNAAAAPGTTSAAGGLTFIDV